MATPEQIRAAMAGLSPDQQRQFMDELEKRHASAQTVAAPMTPFQQAAEAAMGGEGGAYADPNATAEDVASRARTLAAVLGIGAGIGNPVALAKGVGLSLAGGATGGYAGHVLGTGLEYAGAPKGTSQVMGRIGGVAGGLVAPMVGVGPVASLAEGIPGRTGAVARALLSRIGGAAASETAAAPAALSAEEALLAQAVKKYPQIPVEMLRKALQGGASAGETAPVTAAVPRVVSAAVPAAQAPEQLALRIQQLTGGKITPEMEAYLAQLPETEGATMRAALSRLQSRMPPVAAGGPAVPAPAPTVDLEAALRASLRRRAATQALAAQGEGVIAP